MPFISVLEYLMGRIKLEELPEDQRADLARLLAAVNGLLIKFGEYRKVTSGYRTEEANLAAGGSKNSWHKSARAIDLHDFDGKLDLYCTNNLSVLEELGLYLEHPNNTLGWCHLQVKPPKSGKRVFFP